MTINFQLKMKNFRTPLLSRPSHPMITRRAAVIGFYECSEKGTCFIDFVLYGKTMQLIIFFFFFSIEKIRVGRDYQAICPEFIPAEDRKPENEVNDRALLVWSPSKDISDDQLDKYIQIAKEKYGYNGEQALGMLFWHKHDLEKAVLDLGNFTPFPDEWTVEDKVLFEQAFTFHGKTFHRIRQMLPDKSMGSLVKYYYSWKKTRTRTSLMDRQARKLGGVKEETSELGSEQGSNTDSESEEKENEIDFRKTGNIRPTVGPLRGRDRHSYNVFKKKAKPPRGMHIDHEDLVSLASQHSQILFNNLDREISFLKRQVQNNKQTLSSMKRKLNENIQELRPPENISRINSRWTNEELMLAVQGVRKHGKNFKAIAEIIGTKTEAHVRNFFVTYKKKYNLDVVLKEFEAENGLIDLSEEKDEKKEEKINSEKN
ncbi:REST corepressor, putative [Pediculus humanus corporis]|uniref:REST corepressor, putative n=1 Tax=Pediculus humanus subsp. corporis TaxID=121224 RepID=E0VK45_PEDHC|nr:REST corepressor, putative [Pediculus humanus corporis]EEB13751.1 REST corepressor, putative [Pediculus humanus corporis]